MCHHFKVTGLSCVHRICPFLGTLGCWWLEKALNSLGCLLWREKQTLFKAEAWIKLFVAVFMQNCRCRQWDACFISWKCPWGKPKRITIVCFNMTQLLSSPIRSDVTDQEPVRVTRSGFGVGSFLSLTFTSHVQSGDNGTYLMIFLWRWMILSIWSPNKMPDTCSAFRKCPQAATCACSSVELVFHKSSLLFALWS
jgi:hypothetical protein